MAEVVMNVKKFDVYLSDFNEDDMLRAEKEILAELDDFVGERVMITIERMEDDD